MWGNALRPVHLIILLIVVLIVFGWKRLPDAARSFGRSARILKSEMDEMKSENEQRSSASKKTVEGETVERRADDQPATDRPADDFPRRDDAPNA